MIARPRRTLKAMKSLWFALAAATALLAPPALRAQTPARPQAQFQAGDDIVVQAREALRRNDRPRLAALRDAAVAARLPLAQWVEYWELSNRLATATVAEVDAFYARWPGTYVEDRLRNDWLLELGRRRDWVDFARDYPRFRMDDDRQVRCYALLTRHLAGEHVRDEARAAWFAQRDVDDGCQLLASTLFDQHRLDADDVWHKVQLAVESGQPRAAQAAAELISHATGKEVEALLGNPERFLAGPLARRPASRELALLALMRLAARDPQAAATQLEKVWQRRLYTWQASLAWAETARRAALQQQPEADAFYQRAWRLARHKALPGWSDDTLAWAARAALRQDADTPGRWATVEQAIAEMSPQGQQAPAWIYWRARALQALARSDEAGAADRAEARRLMISIAGPMSFYGKLATEALGERIVLPPAPPPLTTAELDRARAVPGFTRALELISLGLRSEGVREWNFTLRDLSGDRELLAAAQIACDREVWDRCINTSDRTRSEIDLAQRFPTPFRSDVVANANAVGLDAADLYALIRQESRFVTDARSYVGASGLMQIMPATARWTAKKIGLPFRPEMLNERDANLKLGASYLKLIFDDFDGSLAMAAAAYNAGPGRPRRWRQGGLVEAAAWAESIPFNETRDYVQKVLSNSVVYAALLNGKLPSLASRLGPAIGPRSAAEPAFAADLP
mgnify:CR=1 FL=1